MNLTMTDSPLSNRAVECAATLPALADTAAPRLAADQLADQIAAHPEAQAALRRLICEGLDGDVDGEVDDAWLASLAEGIRSRAANR